MSVFDIEDEADRGRIVDAIYQCERDKEEFLKPRDQCMALYRGKHWRAKRWRLQSRRPVPFMRTALDTYTQHLSSVRPQALVVTEDPRLQSTADKLGVAANRLFDEIGLAHSLRMFVKEALIGFPLMKICMSRVKTSRMHGWRHEAGQPFTDVVYTRDVVADFSAGSPDRMGFIGNRYRVPLEWVKKNAGRNELYRKKDVDLLTPLARMPLDNKRPTRHAEPIYDMVELIDLYFPFDNQFATIPAPEHHGGDIVLMADDWYGPKGGPYVWPSFAETQDEVLPVPADAALNARQPVYGLHRVLRSRHAAANVLPTRNRRLAGPRLPLRNLTVRPPDNPVEFRQTSVVGGDLQELVDINRVALLLDELR